MHDHGGGISPVEVGGLVLLVPLAVYLIAALRSGGRARWPKRRILAWILGCLVAAVSVHVATTRHEDFTAHAAAHVGLGMLAPLLLVLAAPVTLALRSLSAVPARRLAGVLKSWPVRILAHPVTAGCLSLGGMWLLYAGGLYGSIHTNGILFVAVHVHVFASGCLFTASIACVDPNPHRSGFAVRAVVLCLVAAGHSILAKYLYGHPPAGVSSADAETGSLLMYYGGDVVSVALAVVLCAAWYRDVGRRRERTRARQRPSGFHTDSLSAEPAWVEEGLRTQRSSSP